MATKQTILKIALVVASIAPLLIAIGSTISVLGQLMTTIANLPAILAGAKSTLATFGGAVSGVIAECETIHHTKSTTFAFFQNCIIKNLRVAVDVEIGYDANFYVSCIHAENCDFENCHISGKITGDVFMAYRGIYFDDINTNNQVTNCSVNLTAEKSIYGIHSANEHYFRGCQIQVFGEKSAGFYGNGTLTECQISAMAEENGYGIHAKSSFFATNCEFLGYTKNGQNFDGCRIFGDNSVKIYLNGIKNIAKPPALYSCTNSMKLGKNSTGFYTGIFEPLVNVPVTVYTPQAKNGG